MPPVSSCCSVHLMSRKSAGTYSENKVVRGLPAGWAAHRVDERAGQLGKTTSCDIVGSVGGKPLRIEVKRVTGGFKRLRAWMAPVDIVAVDEPHGSVLVVMTLEKFVELVSRDAD